MSEFRDDIISVYGIYGSKCIKGGVGVIFWDNVGWDVSINVCASVDNDFVGGLGIGNDGRTKLKVEDDFILRMTAVSIKISRCSWYESYCQCR